MLEVGNSTGEGESKKERERRMNRDRKKKRGTREKGRMIRKISCGAALITNYRKKT